jgi:hypothetical protein
MHPPVPRLGGTIDKGACRALAFTLIRKSPVLIFLISTEPTGPCAPFGSLYLKPVVEFPTQNCLPLGSVPCGSGKVSCVGMSPSARIVRVAPAIVGSPTTVFGLPYSLASPATRRLSGLLGSLTRSCFPTIH